MDPRQHIINILNASLERKQIQYCTQSDTWENIALDGNYLNSNLDKIGLYPFKYRVKPQEKYIPFTYESIQPYKDAWIMKVDDKSLHKIISIYENYVIVRGVANIPYNILLECYIFVDGRGNCEIKINE